MCMCVYVPRVCLVPRVDKIIRSLKLELRVAVNHHLGLGTEPEPSKIN